MAAKFHHPADQTALSAVLTGLIAILLSAVLLQTCTTPPRNPTAPESSAPAAATARPEELPDLEGLKLDHPPDLDGGDVTDRPILHIKAVGDIVPGTDYPSNRLHKNPQHLINSVRAELAGADLLFGNFECTMTAWPYSRKPSGRPNVFAFRVPPAYNSLFKKAGFDVMNVANNHSFDFSARGLADTVTSLESAGIKVTGLKDTITYTTVQTHDVSLKIAFIGFSYLYYHNQMQQAERVRQLIRQADQKAHIVVVTFHGGGEGAGALKVSRRREVFLGEDRGNPFAFARTAVDAGADLVLGHGPHVLRAIELYKGRLIAYSLGNFIGWRTLSSSGYNALSMVLSVYLDVDGRLAGGRIIPVEIKKGIPGPDPGGQSIDLVRRLSRKDFPESPLMVNADGSLRLKPSD